MLVKGGPGTGTSADQSGAITLSDKMFITKFYEVLTV